MVSKIQVWWLSSLTLHKINKWINHLTFDLSCHWIYFNFTVFLQLYYISFLNSTSLFLNSRLNSTQVLGMGFLLEALQVYCQRSGILTLYISIVFVVVGNFSVSIDLWYSSHVRIFHDGNITRGSKFTDYLWVLLFPDYLHELMVSFTSTPMVLSIVPVLLFVLLEWRYLETSITSKILTLFTRWEIPRCTTRIVFFFFTTWTIRLPTRLGGNISEWWTVS